MDNLKVGSCIRATARVVILLEVGLEGRGTGAVLRLVAKGGASVEVQVIVISSDLVLTLLHAPEDKGNATEEESAANATDHAANDLLVGVAQAAVVAATIRLRCRWVGECLLTSGNGDISSSRGSDFDLGSVALSCDDGDVGLG